MSLVHQVEAGAMARAAATTLTYDVSGSLPAGVTLTCSTVSTYFDASGVLQSAAINAARFGYDPNRPDKGSGLLIEPASQNWAKNGAFTGAVVASDLTSFNTTTGQNSGTWGTLPGNCGLVIPSLSDGSTSGWQIAGTGTEDGQPYIDVRLKMFNAATPTNPASLSTKIQRFLFTLASGAGVAASAGQTWSVAGRIGVTAGSGALRLTLRSINSATTAQVLDHGIGPSSPGDRAYVSYSDNLTAACTAMTAGISVSTVAQATTDVTIRISYPSLEQQPASTSPILTNNSAYTTRGAVTVTIATGLGAGRYYVRLKGFWSNYDLTVDSANGNIVVTTPPAAILSGAFLFKTIVVSTQPFAPDDRRLRFAPFPLGENVLYMTVPPGARYLPTSTQISPITGLAYGANATFEPDLYVVLTSDVVVTQPIKVVGGHVRVTGVSFAPTDTPPDFAATRSILGLYGCSGAHVEGCLFDGSGVIQRDGANWTGINPVSGIAYPLVPTFQNCRFANLHGQSDQTTINPDGTVGNHSDPLQPFGPSGEVRIDRCTMECSYQPGPFLRYLQAQGNRKVSRINTRWKEWTADPVQNLAHPFTAWLSTPPDDGVAQADWPDTELYQVYVEPRDALITNGAYPSTLYLNHTYAGIAGEGAVTMAWPPAMKVNGCVRQGPPPEGDFCGVLDCGVGYKTPGYGWAP